MMKNISCLEREWTIDAQAFSNGGEWEFQQSYGVQQENQGLFGVDVSPCKVHVVSRKKLKDGGLHTFLGMMGYCRNGKRAF